MTAETAPMSSTVPTQSGSGGLAGSRISGSTRNVAASAIAASGTLTMKIQCQLTCVSRPPSGGPDAAPTAPRAAQAPIAAARRRGGIDGSSSPSEVGVTAAAPAPCRTRAAIRNPSDGDAAHSAEPVPNAASPAANTRRRPMTSPSLPNGTSSAAKTIA